jgi:hypothetical protein
MLRLLDLTYAPMNFLYITDTELLTSSSLTSAIHAAEGHEFDPRRHIVTVRGKAGICSWMSVLHLIYSPGATELLPCVSGWFFAVINDSSNV